MGLIFNFLDDEMAIKWGESVRRMEGGFMRGLFYVVIQATGTEINLWPTL